MTEFVTDLARLTSGAVSDDAEQCWFDFDNVAGQKCRIILHYNILPAVAVSLQALHTRAVAVRADRGLPVESHTLLKKVTSYRFGADTNKQAAVIEAVMEDGTTSAVPFHKNDIPKAIEHLTACLRDFQKPKRH